MDRPRRPTATVTAAKTAGAATVLVAVVLFVTASGPVSVLDTTPNASRTDATPTDTTPFVVEDVASEPTAADATTVTVTYATPANGTRAFVVRDVDPESVDAEGDWAYLPRDALPPALDGSAEDPAVGVVTVGRWALVGDLAAASEPVRASQVTVVAPAGMDVDPGRKAGFLAEFVSPYALHPDPPREVTFVVAPDTLPSSGRTYGETSYITQHAFWDGDATSVWIHEYVHTRQGFELTPEMRWFREGSATYLSGRLLEEQYEGVGERDVRSRLDATADYRKTALANRSAWDGSRADYYRGARLLYAVDGAVRTGSHGNSTLVDVFRAMNRHDGRISVETFVRIVERQAGEDLDWLRSAVTEPGSLDEHVEREGEIFGS
jgi:hypothetical protein